MAGAAQLRAAVAFNQRVEAAFVPIAAHPPGADRARERQRESPSSGAAEPARLITPLDGG
jgi:hypothetical protein